MSRPVDLRLLVAGNCRHPERMARRGGALAAVDFPALVGVIRHPEHGVVLYDTGYAPRFREATASLPEALYRWLIPVRCAEEDTAVAQLRRLGIYPHEVTRVVVSHFHADHVAGLRDFPRATIVYRREALTWRRPGNAPIAASDRWTRLADTAHGFVAGLLPEDLRQRSQAVEDLPIRHHPDLGNVLNPLHDLLGDGSALGVDLPGHVPGQLGLFVPRPRHGPRALFVADACWDARSFTCADLPHPMARVAIHDLPAYHQTLAALGELHRRYGPGSEREILVVPSHCARTIARAEGLWGRP